MYGLSINRALYLVVFFWGLSTDIKAGEQLGSANHSQSRSDKLGDPLPHGAVTRLGTVRWRYPNGVKKVHFIENGKRVLACCADGVFVVSDSVTGKKIRQFGKRFIFPEPHNWCTFAVTPDGASVARATPDGKGDIWNVATGKKSCSFDLGFHEDEPLRGMTFVKGKKLVGWGSFRIEAWDLVAGRRRHLLTPRINQFDRIWQLAVCPKSKYLAISLYSLNGDGRFAIAVWKNMDAKPRTLCPVAKHWTRPIFTPDGRYLAWPGGKGTLELYDARTLKRIRSMGKPSKNRTLQDVRFSPDGKMLAMVIQDGTIRVVDVATGKERYFGDKLPNEDELPYMGDEPTKGIAWSPGSDRIVQTWGLAMIRILDVRTSRAADSSAAHVGAILGLTVSEDGKTALTVGKDNTLRTWDVATAKEQERLHLPLASKWGPFLDGGRVFLHKKDHLHIWGVEEKKELVDFGRHDFTKTRYFVYPKRRRLLVIENNRAFNSVLPASYPNAAKLYDLKTGKESWPKFDQPWLRKPIPPALKENLASLAYAHDGNREVATVAVLYPGPGRFGPLYRYLIRCKSCRDDSSFDWETQRTGLALSFTPDDRAILTFNLVQLGPPSSVSLLESTTGRERYNFELFTDVIPVYAISRNGNLLAVAAVDETMVIDIRRGKIIAKLNGNQGNVYDVAFGSNSTRLFTAGSFGTVLVWDLQRQIDKARATVKLTAGRTQRLWKQLADAETTKAYQAVATLVNAPDQAVRLLRRNLKPVEKVPKAKISKFIAALNSKSFKKREKAYHELLRIGPQCKGTLLGCLKTGTTLELRKRAMNLLVEIRKKYAIPNQRELQKLRAIEVLEVIGTKSARSVLTMLANGATEVRLTRHAKAALERLNQAP